MNNWEVFKEEKLKELEGQIQFFTNKLSKIRSNGISLELIRDLQVTDSRGEKNFLKSFATLKVTPNNELVVKAFEQKNIQNIKKAIQNKDLGYNLERSDKEELYFSVSPMTGEIKERMIKNVNLECENVKKSFRLINQDFKNFLKKEKSFSQDQKKSFEKQFGKILDDYQGKVNLIEKKKIEELKK